MREVDDALHALVGGPQTPNRTHPGQGADHGHDQPEGECRENPRASLLPRSQFSRAHGGLAEAQHQPKPERNFNDSASESGLADDIGEQDAGRHNKRSGRHQQHRPEH